MVAGWQKWNLFQATKIPVVCCIESAFQENCFFFVFGNAVSNPAVLYQLDSGKVLVNPADIFM